MAILHLVRHGQHNLGTRALAGRTPGVGLSEIGRAEIEAVAERLAREPIAALYASPLQRTHETAEIISARLGLPIQFRDAFIELDFGEWTGSTYEAIRADPRWQRWAAHRSLATIPGGENMREVQRRAVEALLDINESLGDGTAAICSHGDVIRGMLVFALGMPLDFYNRIEVIQGSISTISIDARGIRVTALNHRPHLG
ncbi:MAG TPA: histidine phosphatase family protein [Stellaceae bacterium]|nr:histidine phosphatase family protein [Stellaceae bacterium]